MRRVLRVEFRFVESSQIESEVYKRVIFIEPMERKKTEGTEMIGSFISVQRVINR